MKILITGSNGFIGNEIFNRLTAKNHSCISLNRNNSDINIDLSTNIPSFKNKFDLVIHCAGKAHTTPKSKKQKDTFYEVNVKGTKNLLTGLKLTSIPNRFVFISSVSVYGMSQGINIKENNELLADDIYGKTKILAEKLIIDWCIENKVNYTILRLPLIVGVNPKGNLKNMIAGIKKGYYFNIDGGKSKKSMVNSKDIAENIIKISENKGIYNLTDGINPSVFEISEIIAKRYNRKFILNIPYAIAKFISLFGDIIPIIPINSLKLNKLTSTLTFDDSKARKKFNWSPTPVTKNLEVILKND